MLKLSSPIPTAERIADMRKSFSPLPIDPADEAMLYELVLHAIDSTVEHMAGHVNRAKLVFKEENSALIMAGILCRALEVQFRCTFKDLLK